MSRAGRKTLGGTALSRLKYPCLVPSCESTFRSDVLKTHYLNSVNFDKDGFPIDPESSEFGKLNQKYKDHTRFFFNNGYSLQKLPNPGKPVGAKNSVLKYFSPGNVQSAETEKAEEDEKRQRCESENTAGCSSWLEANDDQRDTCEEVSGNDEENDEEMELQRRLNVSRGHDATEEHNMEPQISSGGDYRAWQDRRVKNKCTLILEPVYLVVHMLKLTMEVGKLTIMRWKWK